MSTPEPRMTSIIAYREICDSGLLGDTQKNVIQALAERGPQTGRELDDYLCSPDAHKRLSELEDMGVARSAGMKVCSVTQREVVSWELTGEKPTPPKAKPGDTPTKNELKKATDELSAKLKQLKTLDPNFKLGPELVKVGQWLRKKTA